MQSNQGNIKSDRKTNKRSNRFSQQGKQANQKMKPYLVFQYLMKYSDEDHVVTASDIVAYLQEVGIPAERRSVYRDIEEINKALYIAEYDCKELK